MDLAIAKLIREAQDWVTRAINVPLARVNVFGIHTGGELMSPATLAASS